MPAHFRLVLMPRWRGPQDKVVLTECPHLERKVLLPLSLHFLQELMPFIIVISALPLLCLPLLVRVKHAVRWAVMLIPDLDVSLNEYFVHMFSFD
jgi:hypothetical protein